VQTDLFAGYDAHWKAHSKVSSANARALNPRQKRDGWRSKVRSLNRGSPPRGIASDYRSYFCALTDSAMKCIVRERRLSYRKPGSTKNKCAHQYRRTSTNRYGQYDEWNERYVTPRSRNQANKNRSQPDGE
jgi:hypothetical protein